MGKIRFGLIGSGWRAEFYIRIAKAVPEQFELTKVLIRDKEKGEAFGRRHNVRTVQTLEELLADSGFIRCHQSYLVNSRHLRQLGGSTVLLSDGTSLPVSRTYYKHLKNILTIQHTGGY